MGIPSQTLFIAYPRKREAPSDGAQSKTLRSDVFLPFDVCPSYRECETAKCRIIEFVILDDSLKRTAFPPMIQLHFREPSCVKRDGPFSASDFEKPVFGRAEELAVCVNESPNEPRAGDAAHFNVCSRNPPHQEPLERAPCRPGRRWTTQLSGYFSEPFKSGELCLEAT